jgi:hypothetical protein
MALTPDVKSFLFDPDRTAAASLRELNGEYVYALDRPENVVIRDRLLAALKDTLKPILERDGTHHMQANGGDRIIDNPKLRATIEAMAEGILYYMYEVGVAHQGSDVRLKNDIGSDQQFFREFMIDRLSQPANGAWENACHRLGVPYPPADPGRAHAEAYLAADHLGRSIIGACMMATQKCGMATGWSGGLHGRGRFGDLGQACVCDP